MMLISVLLCVLLSQFVAGDDDVTFNHIGRALIWTSHNAAYNVSYNGRSEFLRLTHTSGDDVSVELEVNGVKIPHQHSPSYWHITMTPQRLPGGCPDVQCQLSVVVIVVVTGARSIPVQLEKGNMLLNHAVIQNTLQISEKRTYAYYLAPSAVPVMITMTPGDQNNNMDLDLFGYHETSSVYFYPNMQEQNHVGGYPESIGLSEDKPYFVVGDLYFLEVYASADSSYQANSYVIGVSENYVAEDDWFDYYLFGFIIIVGCAFVFSLAVSIACGYIHSLPGVRSRISYWLRLRDNPNPNGASKAELKTIDVVALDNLNVDLEEDICSICLDSFDDEVPISRLPCHHIFHKDCSERWLLRNKTCPLCKHDISRPLNDAESVDVSGEGGDAQQQTPLQRFTQIFVGRSNASRRSTDDEFH